MQPRVLPKQTGQRLDQQTRDWIKKLLNSGKECLEVVKITGASRGRVYDIYNEITLAEKPTRRNGTESYKPEPVVLKCNGEKWCNCVRCRAEAAKTQAVRLAMHASDELTRVDYFRAKIGGAT